VGLRCRLFTKFETVALPQRRKDAEENAENTPAEYIGELRGSRVGSRPSKTAEFRRGVLAFSALSLRLCVSAGILCFTIHVP